MTSTDGIIIELGFRNQTNYFSNKQRKAYLRQPRNNNILKFHFVMYFLKCLSFKAKKLLVPK